MNGAYLHLVVNHIPVVAMPIFALLLLAGVWRKNAPWVQAALFGFVLVALVTIVANQSGESAEGIVRGIPGIERGRIHDHEEAAEGAFIATEVLGVLSFIALWLQRRPAGIPKMVPGLLVAISLIISCWMSWVAHLGGLIRHPEIEPGFSATVQPTESR